MEGITRATIGIVLIQTHKTDTGTDRTRNLSYDRNQTIHTM